MSALEDISEMTVGPLSLLARQTGIDEHALRAFASGDAQPDVAHIKRIEGVLGQELSKDVFPHELPGPACLDVTEARVLAVRDEQLVRPHMVRKDDLIRLVAAQAGKGERLLGWVKVSEDARWAKGDLVEFPLKDGSVVECHPAQTVTVARKRAASRTGASNG